MLTLQIIEADTGTTAIPQDQPRQKGSTDAQAKASKSFANLMKQLDAPPLSSPPGDFAISAKQMRSRAFSEQSAEPNSSEEKPAAAVTISATLASSAGDQSSAPAREVSLTAGAVLVSASSAGAVHRSPLGFQLPSAVPVSRLTETISLFPATKSSIDANREIIAKNGVDGVAHRSSHQRRSESSSVASSSPVLVAPILAPATNVYLPEIIRDRVPNAPASSSDDAIDTAAIATSHQAVPQKTEVSASGSLAATTQADLPSSATGVERLPAFYAETLNPAGNLAGPETKETDAEHVSTEMTRISAKSDDSAKTSTAPTGSSPRPVRIMSVLATKSAAEVSGSIAFEDGQQSQHSETGNLPALGAKQGSQQASLNRSQNPGAVLNANLDIGQSVPRESVLTTSAAVSESLINDPAAPAQGAQRPVSDLTRAGEHAGGGTGPKTLQKTATLSTSNSSSVAASAPVAELTAADSLEAPLKTGAISTPSSPVKGTEMQASLKEGRVVKSEPNTAVSLDGKAVPESAHSLEVNSDDSVQSSPIAKTSVALLANPFLSMDEVATLNKPQLNAVTRVLETRLADTDQGVAAIRAQMSLGQVSAAMQVISAASLTAITAQVPSLHQYLAESNVPVHHLAVDLDSRSSEGRSEQERGQSDHGDASSTSQVSLNTSSSASPRAFEEEHQQGNSISIRA